MRLTHYNLTACNGKCNNCLAAFDNHRNSAFKMSKFIEKPFLDIIGTNSRARSKLFPPEMVCVRRKRSEDEANVRAQSTKSKARQLFLPLVLLLSVAVIVAGCCRSLSFRINCNAIVIPIIVHNYFILFRLFNSFFFLVFLHGVGFYEHRLHHFDCFVVVPFAQSVEKRNRQTNVIAHFIKINYGRTIKEMLMKIANNGRVKINCFFSC